MNILTHMPRLKGFRYPREIIAYAVWAHHRFALSTADVEDLLAARGMITDKLRSYIQPISKLAPGADHRAHKGLNNAIEVSHRPTRKREKIFGRFKSHRQAQRFLSAHDQISLIFRPRRYQLTATSYRHARTDAFNLWSD
ncbi:DDE-type integrase/transposase/recombinase, partial [Rhodobacteraceae bacterium KMM 6894]|nr:DDE-type integrase/transposase/recombinase [Rhodobacteraceae bacterium KMM 6894]